LVKHRSTQRRNAVIAALLLQVWSSYARADGVDASIGDLSSSNYKTRLSAALTLAKSMDARATAALMNVLQSDSDSALRRVAAMALGRRAGDLPDATVEKVRTALTTASTKDDDPKVRDSASAALKSLPPVKAASNGKAPAIYVHIDKIVDQSKKASAAGIALVGKNVRRAVDDIGLATNWPGGVPSKSDLATSHSKAFIVVATVTKLTVKKKANDAEVACSVAIRVSPWTGRDGNEMWEANKSASATGSATISTSSEASEILAGSSDCLDALAEDLARRQIVPFLRKIAK
jgi:hypothetical protein